MAAVVGRGRMVMSRFDPFNSKTWGRSDVDGRHSWRVTNSGTTRCRGGGGIERARKNSSGRSVSGTTRGTGGRMQGVRGGPAWNPSMRQGMRFRDERCARVCEDERADEVVTPPCRAISLADGYVSPYLAPRLAVLREVGHG